MYSTSYYLWHFLFIFPLCAASKSTITKPLKEFHFDCAENQAVSAVAFRKVKDDYSLVIRCESLVPSKDIRLINGTERYTHYVSIDSENGGQNVQKSCQGGEVIHGIDGKFLGGTRLIRFKCKSLTDDQSHVKKRSITVSLTAADVLCYSILTPPSASIHLIRGRTDKSISGFPTQAINSCSFRRGRVLARFCYYEVRTVQYSRAYHIFKRGAKQNKEFECVDDCCTCDCDQACSLECEAKPQKKQHRRSSESEQSGSNESRTASKSKSQKRSSQSTQSSESKSASKSRSLNSSKHSSRSSSESHESYARYPNSLGVQSLAESDDGCIRRQQKKKFFGVRCGSDCRSKCSQWQAGLLFGSVRYSCSRKNGRGRHKCLCYYNCNNGFNGEGRCKVRERAVTTPSHYDESDSKDDACEAACHGKRCRKTSLGFKRKQFRLRYCHTAICRVQCLGWKAGRIFGSLVRSECKSAKKCVCEFDGLRGEGQCFKPVETPNHSETSTTQQSTGDLQTTTTTTTAAESEQTTTEADQLSMTTTQLAETTAPGGGGSSPGSQESCSAKLDVIFVVDESLSVGAENYDLVKQFVSSLVDSFDVDSGNVRIGTLRYSGVPYFGVNIVHHLNELTSAAEIKSKIEAMDYAAGRTATGVALEVCRDQMMTEAKGQRSDAQDIVIVVTDGKTNDGVSPGIPASDLRLSGSMLYVVGVTDGVNQTELESIAGDPTRIYNVASFEQLSADIGSAITKQVCKEATSTQQEDEDQADVCLEAGQIVVRRLKRQTEPSNEGYLSKWFEGCDSGSEHCVTLCEAYVRGIVFGQIIQAQCSERPGRVGSHCHCEYSVDQEGRDGEGVCTDEKPKCTTPLDLVFVIDESLSVGADNYIKMKQFAADMVDSFDVDSGQTQIGCVRYSGIPYFGVNLVFNLNKYTTSTDIKQEILSMAYAAGRTATGEALVVVRDQMLLPTAGARTDSVKVVMVVTDGLTNDGVLPAVPAYDLIASDVLVYAVGVDNNGALSANGSTELLDMVVDPTRFFLIDSFDGLGDTIARQVAQQTCKESEEQNQIVTTPAPVPDEEAPEEEDECSKDLLMDIVFIVDESASVTEANYVKGKQFMADLASSLPVDSGAAQIGTIRYSGIPYFGVKIVHYLNTYSTSAQIAQTVADMPYAAGRTATGEALRVANSDILQVSKGMRQEAQPVVILQTDGITNDGVDPGIASAELLARGVLVFVIGVTDGVDMNELNRIANDTNNVFTAESYDVLGPEIVTRITEGVCRKAKEKQEEKENADEEKYPGDEESPPEDEESPPLDEESPPLDEEGPPLDEESPPLDEESPPVDEEGPPTAQENPLDFEEGPPIDEEHPPDEEEEQPPPDEEYPPEEEQPPYEEEDPPAGEQDPQGDGDDETNDEEQATSGDEDADQEGSSPGSCGQLIGCLNDYNKWHIWPSSDCDVVGCQAMCSGWLPGLEYGSLVKAQCRPATCEHEEDEEHDDENSEKSSRSRSQSTKSGSGKSSRSSKSGSRSGSRSRKRSKRHPRSSDTSEDTESSEETSSKSGSSSGSKDRSSGESQIRSKSKSSKSQKSGSKSQKSGSSGSNQEKEKQFPFECYCVFHARGFDKCVAEEGNGLTVGILPGPEEADFKEKTPECSETETRTVDVWFGHGHCLHKSCPEKCASWVPGIKFGVLKESVCEVKKEKQKEKCHCIYESKPAQCIAKQRAKRSRSSGSGSSKESGENRRRHDESQTETVCPASKCNCSCRCKRSIAQQFIHTLG